MDSSTSILALKALDGLSMRAEATAQNIANANSVNYRPVAVTFEAALASAARSGSGAVAKVRPELGYARPPLGPDRGVRLDLELQTATATQLRYSAIVEVLSRQMLLHDLVVTGGR